MYHRRFSVAWEMFKYPLNENFLSIYTTQYTTSDTRQKVTLCMFIRILYFPNLL